ncbi:helix-turn-helix domain-containing protein [Agaribacterium sp. ZY112]|uniref:helix-turn-helix domain-containing protein n=1 Tax=Agaribacterium sp. ZY112 TaxID=3233574 RepID=UPI003523C8D3
MESLDSQFGERVRSARKRRHVSQEELAGRAVIDRSYMSRIERGIVSVSLEKVYLIAQALDCDLSELLPPKDGVTIGDRCPR